MSSTYFILRAPGCIPELKRASVVGDVLFLKELMEARPDAFITVLSIDETGPIVTDGPEYLEQFDRRWRFRASRHRASTKAAFAARK